jgi:hypothetical protein
MQPACITSGLHRVKKGSNGNTKDKTDEYFFFKEKKKYMFSAHQKSQMSAST